MAWREYEKDEHFENMIKEPLKKLSVKQKAQFALICTIRTLPLLSVKRFKHWEQSKIPDYLTPIFMTVDLCAGYLKDMLYHKLNVYFGFYPYSYENFGDVSCYVKNNPDEYKVESAYAVNYIIQTVTYLSESVHFYNHAPELEKYQDGNVEIVFCSTNAAFNQVFTDHNRYLVAKFQELLESDVSKIRRNETDFDNDVSIYNGMFTTFLNDLSSAGLGKWASIYDRLFNRNLQFDENELFDRVLEHERVIQKMCGNNGEIKLSREA